jgi:HEAT repeat protein
MNARLKAVAALRDGPLTATERTMLRNQVLDDWASVGPLICSDLAKADESTALTMLDLIAGSGDHACLDAVRRVVYSKAAEVVRQRAAIALGKVDGSEAFDTLTVLLSDASAAVRLGAVYGLQALGDRRAVEPLARLLKDKAQVRTSWPGSQAGAYEVGKEAALVIQALEERV